MVKRLWAKDESLWPYAKGQKQLIASNLSWLDLPDQIGPYMMRGAALAATTEHEGFRDLVFIAMGDSNLAAETLAQSSAPHGPQRFFLLDNIDPANIRSVSEQLDLDRTLFVLASKSGKRIETHALLLYFLNRLKMHKAVEPGRSFVAVTEDGSYLVGAGEKLRLSRHVSRSAGDQGAIFIAHSFRIVIVRGLAAGSAGIGDAGEGDAGVVQARAG